MNLPPNYREIYGILTGGRQSQMGSHKGVILAIHLTPKGDLFKI